MTVKAVIDMNLKYPLIFIKLSILLLSSGCSYADNSQDEQSMLKVEQMQSWCLGRYAFKIPKESLLIGGMDKYNSFTIKSELNASDEALRNAYAEQLKKYSDKNMKIIEDKAEIKNGNKIIKIFKAKYGKDSRGANDVFAWVLDRGTLFSITGTYSLKYKDLSDEALNNLVNHISFRNNTNLPKQAGVCINNGFITDSGDPYRNSVHSFGFELKQYPSLRIFLETEALARATSDLITRTNYNLKKEGFLAKTNIKTIRKGAKAQISGDRLEGFEWVIKMPMIERDGVLATWEYLGTPRLATDPLIQLEIDTGYDRNNIQTASMNETESIQLYEAILNTIKKF